MEHERKISFAEKDKLGTGSFATVYKGLYQVNDTEKTDVAVKVLRNGSQPPDREFSFEIDVMKTLRHENVIRLYGFEYHADGMGFPDLWVAMELCAGSLGAYIKGELDLEFRLEPSDRGLSTVDITLMHQITQGLAHLHFNNYVHKDLKPDNILIHWRSPTKFTAKLADFGLVRKMEGGLVDAGDIYSGNLLAKAPERAGDSNAYGTSSLDIYSLGVVFFMILTKGSNPFVSHQDVKELKKNQRSGTYCLNHHLLKRRQDAVLLIKKMISRIPSERPTAEEVLQHPTFLERSVKIVFLGQFYDREGLHLERLRQKLQSKDPFGLENWITEFQTGDTKEVGPVLSLYEASDNPLYSLARTFLEVCVEDTLQSRTAISMFYGEPEELTRNDVLSEGVLIHESLNIFERRVPDFVHLVKLSMLEKGDLFYESPHSYGELHNAIEYNDEEEVTKILEEKTVDINEKNPDGNTALHLACERGSPEIVTILLERHAQWDIPNNAGVTPLHRAARRGDDVIIRSLFERKKDLGEHLVTGWTPLHEASSQGHAQSVLCLLGVTQKWARATDRKKRTPLHVAASSSVAKHLLDMEPKLLREEDEDGRTPIFSACEQNRVTLVTFLLDQGATLDLKDSKGNTPLHVAVESSAADVVQLLVQRNPDIVDVRNKENKTPLFCALNRYSTTIVEILLNAGASINQVGSGFETPLKKAIKNDKTEIAKLLIEKGADLDDVDLIVGRTALHLAVKAENLEVAEALLRKGADPDVQDTSDGCTALHYAISCKGDDTAGAFVNLLLRYKANTNLPDDRGETVLHKMAYHRRFYLKDTLIGAGADETLKNTSDETAADIAELECGSTVDSGDEDKRSEEED